MFRTVPFSNNILKLQERLTNAEKLSPQKKGYEFEKIFSELMKLNFSRGKIAALMNTKHKKLYPKHGIILKNKSVSVK